MATQSFTSTGTWVCPPGVNSVIAECWGGGGAGGVASGTASGAGGGAGGQYAIKVVAVTAGTSYTVTVATAAVAVITGGVVTNGSDSWFNTTGTVIAKGGAGGADATGTTGAGGAGSTTGGIGDTVFAGGSGAAGVSSTQSGGGGGGAGSTGTGNSASGATAGAAKANNGGAGGAGVSTANTQNNGQNFGGGGSGGLSSSATNRKGGDGAPGLVVLTWDIDPGIIDIPFTGQGEQRFNAKQFHPSFSPKNIAFVPLVAAGSSITINSDSPGTYAYQTTIIPNSAELARIPDAPASVTNVLLTAQGERWLGARKFHPSYAAWNFVFQGLVPSTTITINADSPGTYSSLTTIIPDTARPIFVPAPSPPETVTIDKWWMRQIYYRAQPKPLPYRFQAGVLSEDMPPVERWLPPSFLPIPPKVPVRRNFSVFQFTPVTVPETVTLDKWFVAARRPLQAQRLPNTDRTVFLHPIVIAESITLDKWMVRNVRPFAERRNPPMNLSTRDLSVSSGGSSVDWRVYQPRITPQRRSLSRDFTVFMPLGVSPETPLAWHIGRVVPPHIFRALRIIYPQFVIDTRFIFPAAVTTGVAVWQNLATVTLKAADLATVTVLLENLSDPTLIVFEDTDVALLVTENLGTGDVMHEDDDIVVINYEDTDIA